MKKITHEWIKKAENDYLVIKNEINSKNPVYDAICFHAQQLYRKIFKSIN